MKKLSFLIAIVAMFMLNSCSTIHNATKVLDTADTPILAASTAELEVAKKKITYIYEATPTIRRGGIKNVITTAVMEALKENDGDTFVAMSYSVKYNNFLWWRIVDKVTITGYPARYKNFESVSKQSLEEKYVNNKKCCK